MNPLKKSLRKSATNTFSWHSSHQKILSVINIMLQVDVRLSVSPSVPPVCLSVLSVCVCQPVLLSVPTVISRQHHLSPFVNRENHVIKFTVPTINFNFLCLFFFCICFVSFFVLSLKFTWTVLLVRCSFIFPFCFFRFISMWNSIRMLPLNNEEEDENCYENKNNNNNNNKKRETSV